MTTARVIVTAWVCAWISGVALAGDWPMSACNPQRTYRTEEDIRGPFELAWVRYFPDAYVPHRVEPIVAGGTVYVASSKGVYALDAATGQEKWLFATAAAGRPRPFGRRRTGLRAGAGQAALRRGRRHAASRSGPSRPGPASSVIR